MNGTLAKEHATFIAVHSGESIEYRRYPGASFASATGYVRRQAVDVMGNVMANAIRVYMSKDDLPTVDVRKDQIRLAQKDIGDAQEIYTVVDATEEVGHWWLLAVRAE
ncbi:MAG: hypothetical protein V2A73_21365 [Pseudomonadota bacterium]